MFPTSANLPSSLATMPRGESLAKEGRQGKKVGKVWSLLSCLLGFALAATAAAGGVFLYFATVPSPPSPTPLPSFFLKALPKAYFTVRVFAKLLHFSTLSFLLLPKSDIYV